MSAPLISIGISFKDPGPYFRLALQSVFAQTVQDWELILVDDGSSDGSGRLAATLADSRVHFHQDGLSRNLNVRLNEMVRRSRGQYFVRMDADDVMHPERLEHQIAALEKAPQGTVIGTGAFSIDSLDRVVGIRRVNSPVQRGGFAARHSFIHPTVASTRTWFLEHPYSEHFLYHRAQDAELWCRTSHESQFWTLPQPLLFYRESDTFSFSNYLGTAMGVLHLAHQYANSQTTKMKQVTKEAAKIWLTTALYGCGRIDWLTDRRFQPIAEETRSEAQDLLLRIASYRLPVAQGLSAA